MAGRPRKMLARVTALEEATFQLALDICEARPQQYVEREGDERDDELATWWNRSSRNVQITLIAIGELLGALERKAGLGEAPERRRLAERGVEGYNEPEENTEGAPT